VGGDGNGSERIEGGIEDTLRTERRNLGKNRRKDVWVGMKGSMKGWKNELEEAIRQESRCVFL